MRSMFSVLVCLFEPSPGDRVAGPRVGKKKVRECVRVFRLTVLREHPLFP
jgi:hypothetical protein